MRRREALLRIVAVGLSLSLESIAQDAKIPVVGLLDAGERTNWWVAFRKRMSELGYVEGKSVIYEPRFARGKLNLLDGLAADLVRRNASVIVTASVVATQAAKRVTDRIPIVTGSGTDHVSLGFAESLARPAGNITGLASLSSDLTAKRLELLREVFPKMTRLAVLWQSGNPGSQAAFRDLQRAAEASKISLQNVGVRKSEDLPGAFAAVTRERPQAIFVVGGPLLGGMYRQIVELANKNKIPTMHTGYEAVDLGGFISYSADFTELFRSAAVYVDKILKGAKPGDLPIEQPSRFELVINRRTAKALGVEIPQTVLVRASRVIE